MTEALGSLDSLAERIEQLDARFLLVALIIWDGVFPDRRELRIVDVGGALGARGYPPGISAELHFDIQDDLLSWNNGRFVLELADGRAQARPGGQGRIRLHARGLATLYSGYMTPQELRVAGTLDGPDQDVAAAGLVFAGPRPWTPDWHCSNR